MIIAIEGMDGVGKTTVARSIEKYFNFKYVKDPLKELLEIDSEHLSRISDKIFAMDDDCIRAWYLALGDAFALQQYKDKNVVMDRHVLLNYFWNGNEKSEEIFNAQIKLFGKPDLTILLYASPKERMKRIAKRNPADPDLHKEKMKEEGYGKLLGFLKRYGYNYIVIDTEGKTIDEVVSICEKYVEKSLKICYYVNKSKKPTNCRYVERNCMQDL